MQLSSPPSSPHLASLAGRGPLPLLHRSLLLHAPGSLSPIQQQATCSLSFQPSGHLSLQPSGHLSLQPSGQLSSLQPSLDAPPPAGPAGHLAPQPSLHVPLPLPPFSQLAPAGAGSLAGAVLGAQLLQQVGPWPLATWLVHALWVSGWEPLARWALGAPSSWPGPPSGPCCGYSNSHVLSSETCWLKHHWFVPAKLLPVPALRPPPSLADPGNCWIC